VNSTETQQAGQSILTRNPDTLMVPVSKLRADTRADIEKARAKIGTESTDARWRIAPVTALLRLIPSVDLAIRTKVAVVWQDYIEAVLVDINQAGIADGYPPLTAEEQSALRTLDAENTVNNVHTEQLVLNVQNKASIESTFNRWISAFNDAARQLNLSERVVRYKGLYFRDRPTFSYSFRTLDLHRSLTSQVSSAIDFWTLDDGGDPQERYFLQLHIHYALDMLRQKLQVFLPHVTPTTTRNKFNENVFYVISPTFFDSTITAQQFYEGSAQVFAASELASHYALDIYPRDIAKLDSAKNLILGLSLKNPGRVSFSHTGDEKAISQDYRRRIKNLERDLANAETELFETEKGIRGLQKHLEQLDEKRPGPSRQDLESWLTQHLSRLPKQTAERDKLALQLINLTEEYAQWSSDVRAAKKRC